ncbi:MAG: hypothetical protein K5669_03140 [Lachnospiraceae bacterium]|nr:hypothetical protein [Lachnospiraceae bacterium]
MKKKLLSVILSLGLALSFPITAMADTITGGDNWNVFFTADEKMESTFSSSTMSDQISGMQPGDTAIFTVNLGNNNSNTTDWYMTNKVLYSLEDRSKNSGTKGGAYTYLLTYTSPSGTVSTIFDSETIGGEGSSAAGTGLHQATEALKDFFYLDTLENGQKGKITLKIELDGETQGNDYQDTLADLQMNFAVMLRTAGETEDGGGTETGKERTPRYVQTGDETNLKPFFIIAGGSALVLFVLGIIGVSERRKAKKGGEA